MLTIGFTIATDPARYLFVRLFSRKNGWFRVSKIGYHDELVDVQAAVDEICETNAPTSDGTTTVEERSEPEAGPSGTSGSVVPSSSQHQDVGDSGIILIDSDDEDPKAGKGKAKSLAKSKKVGKLEGAKDPLSNRPVKEVKKEIQDFGLTRFAINERILAERNDVDELLSLLSLDELKVNRLLMRFLRSTYALLTSLFNPICLGAWKRAAHTVQFHYSTNDNGGYQADFL